MQNLPLMATFVGLPKSSIARGGRMTQDTVERFEQILSFIQSRIAPEKHPRLGIVLGTGLGEWVQNLDKAFFLSYTDLPGFPQSTVETHTGRLAYAELNSVPLWILQGRFHLYEGYDAEQVCTGIRVLGLLGVDTVILTNASGAINPDFSVGNIMLIRDHINMTGHNPLRGENIEQWGPRFPDMSQVYSETLQEAAVNAGLSAGLRLERGTYLGLTGPSLETPAETRALRRMGADAVGMSTVLEAIAARHMGLDILGLSCLTNKNIPGCMQETSFEEIKEQAELTSRDLGRLLEVVIPRI